MVAATMPSHRDWLDVEGIVARGSPATRCDAMLSNRHTSVKAIDLATIVN